MDEQKQSYLMYVNYYDILKDLKNEDLGLLFRAIMAYQKNVEYELNPSIMIAFKFIQNQFEIDSNKYEKIKERNKNNGKKGGRPKTQNNPDNPVGFLGFENNPDKPKLTQQKPNDNDNDNDNVNDNVNVNVNDNDNDEVLENQKNKNQEETKEIKTTTIKDVENFINSYGRNIEPREKKKDPCIISPIERKFKEEYKKIFNNHLYLVTAHKNKINELNAEIEDFEKTIPIVLKRLKKINFKDIGFKPSVDWLLKNTNYTSVLNGEYEKEKSNLISVLEKERERQEELLKQQGGTTK